MLLLSLLLATAGQAANLEIRDPTFYDILAKRTQLDCRYVIDSSFGFLLERGDDDQIRVSLITNGQNEGPGSAFTAEIKTRAAIGLYVYRFERNGQYGRYAEFELRNQRNPRLGYKLPGRYMQTSALFRRDEKGEEVEDRYPDTSRPLACELRRLP